MYGTNETPKIPGIESVAHQLEPTPEEKAAEELLAVYSQKMDQLLGEPGDHGVRNKHVQQEELYDREDTVMLHLDLGLGTPSMTRYTAQDETRKNPDRYEISSINSEGGLVEMKWTAGSPWVHEFTRSNPAERGNGSSKLMDSSYAQIFDGYLGQINDEIDRISELPPPEGEPASPVVDIVGIRHAVGGVAARSLTDI